MAICAHAGAGHDCIELRADIKRFRDRYALSSEFRSCVDAAGPNACSDEWRLPLGAYSAIVEGTRATTPAELYDVFDCWQERRREMQDSVRAISRLESADARIEDWRRIHKSRFILQSDPSLGQTLVHAPYAIELSQGCSGRCWFCGVSAEKLTGVAEHAKYGPQFREILFALRDLLGQELASTGFLYWATDPLDNPDYEAYLSDFCEVMGTYPQTTTALAAKYPQRASDIFRVTRPRMRIPNRVSILSLTQYEVVSAALSDEDYLGVEIVPQTKDSLGQKTLVGRAAEAPARLLKQVRTDIRGTSACVTGPLINLCGGSYRIISPVPSSEEFPLGYVTYAHDWFSGDAAGRQVSESLAAVSRRSLAVTSKLSINAGIRLCGGDRALNVRGPGGSLEFSFSSPEGVVRMLEEGATLGGVTKALMVEGVDPREVVGLIKALYKHGILDFV